MKDVWGADVAIKLSPAGGYNDVGMPLDDTIDTYGYLLREVEQLRLAYIALVRYHPDFDEEVDGKPATQHDVLATFRPFLHTTPFFLNAGLVPAKLKSLSAVVMSTGMF